MRHCRRRPRRLRPTPPLLLLPPGGRGLHLPRRQRDEGGDGDADLDDDEEEAGEGALGGLFVGLVALSDRLLRRSPKSPCGFLPRRALETN